MAGKPKLYYFDGRGKMESVRWLLAAAGVEFEEEFLETREQYEKLLQGGSLLFQQVPIVEIDGMKMVQTRAILSYIAAKYNLYGKDLMERALIDMYVGGTDDLMAFILIFPFLSAEDKEKQHAVIVQKVTSRYFPAYEKNEGKMNNSFAPARGKKWMAVEAAKCAPTTGKQRQTNFSLPVKHVFHLFSEDDGNEGHQKLRSMSGKPRLTYCNGRGRMEPVRWLLAAAGVEFEEIFLETREQYEKLIKDGVLMFQQVPLVEIDGMKMVQTRAILSYIAGKYNLYGKDLKERALIDMYVEGITDLMQMILMFPFSPPEAKEKNLDSIKERATNRYFPVFEKVLKQHGQDFLVGNKFSWADVQLIEAILAVEEKIPAVLSGFPQLQAFKIRMSNMPTIKKFLQPGSPRKPPPDESYRETVLKIFRK